MLRQARGALLLAERRLVHPLEVVVEPRGEDLRLLRPQQQRPSAPAGHREPLRRRRCVGDDGARLLDRLRDDPTAHDDVPVLAVVLEPVVAGRVPGEIADLEELHHDLVPRLDVDAVAGELVGRVAGADPDDDLPVRELVEEVALRDEADGVHQGHDVDGEADVERRVPLADRGRQGQRVRVGVVSGEVVLGEPDVGEAELLRAVDLPQHLVEDAAVVVGTRRLRVEVVAEAHRSSLAC